MSYSAKFNINVWAVVYC